jgi:hypothetical protein
MQIIYKISTQAFLLLLISFAMAQSPSEMRRKKQESTSQDNESDKKSGGDKRQDRLDKINRDIVFGDDEAMFKVSEVNPKWQKESAVIIAQKLKYSYLSSGDNSQLVQLFRRRIKLQDKAAVDFFAEFYFSTSEEIGIRIIKKNGKVKDVDISKAVDVDGKVVVSSFYYSLAGSTGKKKLPMQDLEIGDIIDYYYKYVYFEVTANAVSAIAFTPVIFNLNWSYPVMIQKIDFEVERGFCINFNSTNGAPKIMPTESTNRRIKNFSFVDKDREKEQEVMWNYIYRTSPTVKFQVVYTSPRNKDEAPYFLGELWTPKSEVSAKELEEVANRIFLAPNSFTDFFADDVIKYLSKKYKDKDSKDMQKYVEDAYAYLRYIALVYPTDWKGTTIVAESEAGGKPEYRQEIDDILFVKVMAAVFKKKKLPFDVLCAIPRHIGTIKELILTSEISWLIKVNVGKDLFLYPCTRQSLPGDSKQSLEGTEAYVVKPNRNKELVQVSTVTLPQTSHQQNTTSVLLEASLNDKLDIVTIIRRYEITGLAKNAFFPLVSLPTDEMKSDKKIFHPESQEERGNKKRLEETRKKRQETQESLEKERMDDMKKEATDDFEVDAYEKFELNQDGRQKDASELIFNEKLTAKNLVKKVGPNYLFEIGKLIGEQIKLKEEDLKRTVDVYMSYARSYTYDIAVVLPAGYVVDGLDALNMKVENATGAFVSSAKLEGKKVIVKVSKHYNHNFENKKDWPVMTQFLEKAYDFTQKKVLLKKG